MGEHWLATFAILALDEVERNRPDSSAATSYQRTSTE